MDTTSAVSNGRRKEWLNSCRIILIILVSDRKEQSLKLARFNLFHNLIQKGTFHANH
jgi:hypothetical protein